MAEWTTGNTRKAKEFKSSMVDDLFGLNTLNSLFDEIDDYEQTSNIGVPRGADAAQVNTGEKYTSLINKMHIIKLAGNFPASEKNLINNDFFKCYSTVDLCKIQNYGAVVYEPEDFLYCKNVGIPINRLITLRRFPVACQDNIIDYATQQQPDIARMVTYMTQDVIKIEDVLAFSYGLRWKELTAEFDQMSMFGEQSGVTGFIKTVAKVFDPVTNANYVSGAATGGPMSQYDPKFDQNRVYGPVDSVNQTNIRDVGFDFSKDFEITFDYELRSIAGRTPEYAMKDLIANILAVTYNNGKFWGGARYWVGERPSPWATKLAWMNSGDIDTVLKNMGNLLKSGLQRFFGDPKGSALKTLKTALKGGFALAIGKLLDGLGRPGIPAMQSLLSSDPTGCWHLTIGNPLNPIMSIGNLIETGVDIKFPTDTLSFGDFPTKIQVVVKLKPGQPKDKAGIETMFNQGRQRIYWNPKKVTGTKTTQGKSSNKKFGSSFQPIDIQRAVNESFDFLPIVGNKIEDVEIELDASVVTYNNPYEAGPSEYLTSDKADSMKGNSEA